MACHRGGGRIVDGPTVTRRKGPVIGTDSERLFISGELRDRELERGRELERT